MINKPNRRSSDVQPFLVPILLIPLVGFFVTAVICQLHFHQSFFLILALALCAILAVLFYYRADLRRKQTQSNLVKQDLFERNNVLVDEIGKEEKAIGALREKIVNYSRLKDLTEQLCMSLSLQDTAKAVLSGIQQSFPQHSDVTVILYLFHAQKGELAIIGTQKGDAPASVKAKQGDIYDQWVIKTMKPLLIEDVKSDFRFDADKIPLEDPRPIRTLMSVPLIVDDKPLGILRLDSPQERRFTTDDLRLVTAVGDLSAVAIENAQAYEQVEDLAIHDSLTSLYLRRHLLERLPQEISRGMRLKKDVSFLMIDLDDFKKYNDRLGHSAGDIVLRTIGLLLGGLFAGPGNIVCRYGGEEFAVLLPDCPKEKAVEMAQEFRRRVEKQAILLRREQTHITVSIGVASFPKDAQMKDELIQHADLALYRAKKQGKNRVCSA